MDPHELPATEHVNPSTHDLDLLDTKALLHRINDEDRRAAWAVEREIDALATAVDEIVARLRRGGRLHYFGAGTSGRIAAQDAAEIGPTFSMSELVVAHIAGGSAALHTAVEAAEDDAKAGHSEAQGARLGPSDAVIGLSASGHAAYVLEALRTAQSEGALTIGITCDPSSALAHNVQIPIVLRTGPEVIAGSTRMKAGAAQKMALTMLSTAVMVKLGRVFGNLMVDLQATNAKLRNRAQRLVAAITGAEAQAARNALEHSGYRVKTAVVMLKAQCTMREADELLATFDGNLRATLDCLARKTHAGKGQQENPKRRQGED